MNTTPIGTGELEALFRPLATHDHCGLAVSGGADSQALMHLAARWRAAARGAGQKLTVLTVDHGLRPESADEAVRVARAAEALGLPHVTLRWTGPKPRTGLQAAARAARYDLMASFAHAHGLDGLVTAHHLDDQAETVLMRLARGSGPAGLGGMAETGAWAGVPLHRPLLDLPRACLEATLRRDGIDWIDDPSNENRRFERVRVREAMAVLSGLGFTAAAIARSAQRIRRANAALDHAAEAFLRASGRLCDAGYGMIDRNAFRAMPEEVALRALQRLLQSVGGGDAARLARLEILTDHLRGVTEGARTLAGCKVIARGADVLVLREPGRQGLGEIRLEPGETGLWDRRFAVSVPGRMASPVTVRALGREGFRELRARLGRRLDLPAAAAHTTASFWQHSRLIAVPQLGFAPAPFAARFVSGAAR